MINKSLKLKFPISPHNLVERFSCSGELDCTNSKCGSCSTPPQWENNGSTSSEDEVSLNDSNDDAEKKIVTFCWGKIESTQKICITADKDEA